MQPMAIVAVLAAAAIQATGAQTESQKIEALIRHVESLQGAKFVRNGADYDSTAAAQFLRGKWKTQESNIKTAKDFIDKVASVSSTSGKPYVIKLSDGREVKSGEYLTTELKKLDARKE